jgi:transposase-like protein
MAPRSRYAKADQLVVSDGDNAILAALAAGINAEHEQVWRAGRVALEHAVRAGELLLKAQEIVGSGYWTKWMAANVRVHPTTAYRYIRLGRYSAEVLASDAEGVEEALRSIAGHPWKDRKRIDEATKEQMVVLATEHGATITEIAEMFGCSESTVWYWVSPKSRAAHVRQQQQRADRLARASDELRSKRTARLARAAGGDAAEAYSLMRRCAQKLDYAAADEHAREAKAALEAALALLHKAEDELGRAIRLSSGKKSKKTG